MFHASLAPDSEQAYQRLYVRDRSDDEMDADCEVLFHLESSSECVIDQ